MQNVSRKRSKLGIWLCKKVIAW